MQYYFTSELLWENIQQKKKGRHEDTHFCTICEGKQTTIVRILHMWMVILKTKQKNMFLNSVT